MLKFTTLPQTLRYDLPQQPGFYVLIVPDHTEKVYNFYLTHTRYGDALHMFGTSYNNHTTTPEMLVEMAARNAGDYLPDFICKYFAEEE